MRKFILGVVTGVVSTIGITTLLAYVEEKRLLREIGDYDFDDDDFDDYGFDDYMCDHRQDEYEGDIGDEPKETGEEAKDKTDEPLDKNGNGSGESEE